MKSDNLSLSSNDKITLVSNLSTMLSAGIPILEAVDSLLEDAKKNVKKVLDTLRNDLVQGKPVYSSFAKFPNVFDKVIINIIKASEEAGTLDVTLKDLKDTIKRDIEFNDRLKSAMIYPLFIIGVFIGVMLMILIVVIPKITTVFASLKVALPLPTKVLLAMSNAILNYPVYTIAGTIVFTALIIIIFKTKRLLLTRIFLTFPIISGLAKKIDIMRFTRSFYLLLNAGIPITTALTLSEEVVMKKEIGAAIHRAREMVVSGKKLSAGFKEHRSVFPSIMIKITEAGERSGSLDKSMQDVFEYLSYEVDKALRTATALIEPIMIVFIGVLIGGIMLSIIAPMYSLISQVAPH